MADFLDPAARSVRMAAVRQHGTDLERKLRSALHALGLRFRIDGAGLPGRPDLVFPRYRVAVFVHGCFWHTHSCPAGRPPATKRDYWLPKLQDNTRRDRRTARALRAMGWHVFTIWGCQLKPSAKLTATAARLAARIVGAGRV